jgi:hypothetical protein
LVGRDRHVDVLDARMRDDDFDVARSAKQGQRERRKRRTASETAHREHTRSARIVHARRSFLEATQVDVVDALDDDTAGERARKNVGEKGRRESPCRCDPEVKERATPESAGEREREAHAEERPRYESAPTSTRVRINASHQKDSPMPIEIA